MKPETDGSFDTNPEMERVGFVIKLIHCAETNVTYNQ